MKNAAIVRPNTSRFENAEHSTNRMLDNASE